MELSIRDGQGAGVNLTKKWEKEKENSERLQEDLDAVKADRDKKVFDFQTKLEKERETFNVRKREVEKRAQDTENKQTTLMLTHESEKAQLEQRITDMKH